MDGIEKSKLLDANPEQIPQVCSEIESEFGIKFPMKNVLTMKNVGELVDIIQEEV